MFPYNVIKMITKTFFNNDILFGFNNVLSKDKNIFVINDNTVSVGNFKNELLLFISNFVFEYDNKNILEDEMKKLLSSSIKNYIEIRHCNTSKYNEIQIMKNEQFKNIGKLLILKNKSNELDNNQNKLPSHIKKNVNRSQKRDNSTGRKLSNQNKFNHTETKKTRNISLDKDYLKNNKDFNIKNLFNNNYDININNELNGNEKDIKNINKIIIKENNSLEENIQKIFQKDKR